MMLRLTRAALAAAISFAALTGVAGAQSSPAPAAAPAAEPAPAGDPAAGEKVFLKCRACHQIGPTAENNIGPELNGVIGRKAGSAPGYNYSQANKSSGITWDVATFEKYIANPQAVVPHTKMSFAGDSNEKDLANLVAYVSQFGPDGQMKK